MPTSRLRTARPLALVGVLLAVALLGAACSGSETSTTSGSDASEGTVPVANRERDAGPVAVGGKLSVGIFGETNSFNPFVGMWSQTAYVVANAVFEPLAAVGPDDDVRPYLAESFTPNTDFTTWTIGIRPGVTFHDGTPVDAAAVATNLEAARTSLLAAPTFASMSSAVAVGERTVVVTMNRPWSSFPAILVNQAGYVVAPSMLSDPEGGVSRLVGSGPFRLVQRVPDQRVELERNPSYWQTDDEGRRLPYLDAIDFRVIPDPNARIAALRTGDLDASFTATGAELAAAHEALAEGRAYLLTEEGRETDEQVLALNTATPPFDDPVARMAVAHAVDREALVATATQNQAHAAWGLFDDSSPWYLDPASAGLPAHDPERARQLAGEYQAAHGTPLTFRILTLPDTELLNESQTLQAQLREVGIATEIDSLDLSSLIARVVASGDYQAAVFAMWSSPSPDQGYVFLATPANRNGISTNFPRYDDPELRAAMDDFRTTGDPVRQKAAIDVVQRRLAQDQQVIFLQRAWFGFTYAADVHGFTANWFPGTTTLASAPYAVTPFFTHVWISST